MRTSQMLGFRSGSAIVRVRTAMIDPRAAYERWSNRKPTFWLAIGFLALVFAAQVFVQSLNSGTETAIVRALLVAGGVSAIGALFVHLIERDLQSRLALPAPGAGQLGTIDGALVVRPTPWKTWYYLTLPVIVVGTATVFLWTTSGTSDGHRIGAWICFVFSLVFTPIFIGMAWLFVHNAKLELTDRALIKTDWRSARTVIDRAKIGRVLRLAVDRSGVSGRSTWIARYWVFASPDQHALAIVNRSAWPMGDLEILVGRLGVPIDGSWDDVLKPRQVRKRVKGVSSWFEAHPWVSLVGVVVLTMVFAVVLISVSGSHQ